MDRKILDEYLGKSYFKRDVRKVELLKDSVNLNQWEVNIHFAMRGLRRDELLPDEDEQKIIYTVTPTFAEIVENMLWGTDCPPALNLNDMLWYIAAYPDVVNFFYPAVNYSKYKGEARDKIDKTRHAKNELIRMFEKQVLHKQNQEAEPSVFEYFVALKDFYKSKKKLMLSKV